MSELSRVNKRRVFLLLQSGVITEWERSGGVMVPCGEWIWWTREWSSSKTGNGEHHNCEGTNKTDDVNTDTKIHFYCNLVLRWSDNIKHDARKDAVCDDDAVRQSLTRTRLLTGPSLSPEVQIEVQILHHISELVVFWILSELKRDKGHTRYSPHTQLKLYNNHH